MFDVTGSNMETWEMRYTAWSLRLSGSQKVTTGKWVQAEYDDLWVIQILKEFLSF